jgi:hypothetical protein
MQYQHPYQCDICFQPYSPFTTMRVLPVTPIITLSGTATPIHVRTPGAKISVCLHCLQSYSNLEPWTDLADLPDPPESFAMPDSPAPSESLDVPESLTIPGSLDPPGSPESLNTPDPPSLSPSPPVHEADTQLTEREVLLILSSPGDGDFYKHKNKHKQFPSRATMGRVRSSFHQRGIPVRSVSSASSVTFSRCHKIRSPPLRGAHLITNSAISTVLPFLLRTKVARWKDCDALRCMNVAPPCTSVFSS